MTNIYKTDLFPYIEGGSLNGKNVSLTIAAFQIEDIPDHKGKPQPRYVLTLVETDKKLILNKTNAKKLADLFGPETDGWMGKTITLYPDTVNAFGKTHTVVRIRGEQ